ncbi:YhgE/Pip family protein [Brevibacillus sp. B_LB10_24]|uniref:YhgE/Pip family protein n=1 Tax=Brevibacillus sp. B_LB10_24 TaxID=3380645 RepID=UPI0038B9ECC4
MKKIGMIFTQDCRNIVTNWVAAVVILGLVFLPSLYAWFNIEASWDPYGQTGGLMVAVVNQDKGTTLRGTPINIGNEIQSSLKENKNIGWIFVDEQQAMQGVMHGDYYASILIPVDFSEKIGTVLTHNPQKAEIIYTVNEKINAIAPKITAKGASGIVEEVSRNFVKTANGTIFSIFNEIGIGLESQRPTIERVRDLVFKLESTIPEIERITTVALDDTKKANEIIHTAQANLPIVTQLAVDGQHFTERLGQFLDQSSEALTEIAPNVKQNLVLLQQTAIAAEQLTAMLQDVKIDSAILTSALDRTARHLTIAIDATGRLLSLFDRLNQLTGGNNLAFVIDKLERINGNLQQQLSVVSTLQDVVNRGERPADEVIDHLHQLSKDASAVIGDLLDRFDDEVLPRIQDGVERAKASAHNAYDVLTDSLHKIPDVQQLLQDAAKGLTIGNQELLAIQKNLPAIKANITSLADLIRTLEKEGTLDQLINLLKNNVQKESEFFSEPVLLKENKLFPIPNYGSAMSPFFTTLSLWVGALLLVSLLTVEVHDRAGYHSYQIYFGRYLTFLTLAVLQSLMVTLGDIWILGTYVVDKLWFVLFGMLISAVFMLMVYTLVSVFGNVGKAMAIVLLVLQLAGSGGTFPIQVTPPFFQAIHPLLPFTYAISMMREAVGGMLWDIVGKDLLVMGVYVAVTLIIGLALKRHINRVTEPLMQKAKESKLIH